MTDNENIFQTPCPKKPTAFNSDIQFGDSARNVTPEQFDSACDRIDQLIDHTRRVLSEENC